MTKLPAKTPAEIEANVREFIDHLGHEIAQLREKARCDIQTFRLRNPDHDDRQYARAIMDRLHCEIAPMQGQREAMIRALANLTSVPPAIFVPADDPILRALPRADV